MKPPVAASETTLVDTGTHVPSARRKFFGFALTSLVSDPSEFLNNVSLAPKLIAFDEKKLNEDFVDEDGNFTAGAGAAATRLSAGAPPGLSPSDPGLTTFPARTGSGGTETIESGTRDGVTASAGTANPTTNARDATIAIDVSREDRTRTRISTQTQDDERQGESARSQREKGSHR